MNNCNSGMSGDAVVNSGVRIIPPSDQSETRKKPIRHA